jgi:hypothetical protein
VDEGVSKESAAGEEMRVDEGLWLAQNHNSIFVEYRVIAGA